MGVVLIAAAVVYQKWFSPGKVGLALVFHRARRHRPSSRSEPVSRNMPINWRALSLTLFFIMLISMLWEAILALPYVGWNYQHWAMMGIFIGAWSELRIEAVLVWLAAMYGTVIVFEAVKIWQAGQTARVAFLGKRPVQPP